MMTWMSWRWFRNHLRSLGMKKSMSGACMAGIIDGVPFELYLDGRLLGKWVAENWMVRPY